MRLITNILISSILGVLLFASPVRISEEKGVMLKTSDSMPVTISMNFEVKSAKLITTKDDMAKLEILKKGFVVIPMRKNYTATVIVSARDGAIYSINFKGGGKDSVFKLEDPIQFHNGEQEEFNFESGKMDQDARNIVIKVLQGKKLSGFIKSNTPEMVKAAQYNLTRNERYIGNKYIVDMWEIHNVTAQPLYFNEEDFYTKGVLAVAIEKNMVLANEKVFLLTILNKNEIFKSQNEY